MRGSSFLHILLLQLLCTTHAAIEPPEAPCAEHCHFAPPRAADHAWLPQPHAMTVTTCRCIKHRMLHQQSHARPTMVIAADSSTIIVLPELATNMVCTRCSNQQNACSSEQRHGTSTQQHKVQATPLRVPLGQYCLQTCLAVPLETQLTNQTAEHSTDSMHQTASTSMTRQPSIGNTQSTACLHPGHTGTANAGERRQHSCHGLQPAVLFSERSSAIYHFF
jgi:hypothetical protein